MLFGDTQLYKNTTNDKDLNNHEINDQGPLGYIVENSFLQSALFDRLQDMNKTGTVDLICPSKLITLSKEKPTALSLSKIKKTKSESTVASNSQDESYERME